MLARLSGSTGKGVILLIIKFWAGTSKKSLESKHFRLFKSSVTLWAFPNGSKTPEHFDGPGKVGQNNIARVHILTNHRARLVRGRILLPRRPVELGAAECSTRIGPISLFWSTQLWHFHQNLLNRVSDGPEDQKLNKDWCSFVSSHSCKRLNNNWNVVLGLV